MDTITKGDTGSAEVKITRTPFLTPIAHPKDDEAIYYVFFKRAFDILASLVLICAILTWLYPILFVLINLSSKGGTLFIQQRVGMNGTVFNCLKFRTMVINTDADIKEASLYDHRITKPGKWLRRTYIDELPQLFNVLYGNMSMVGPRPHMLYHHHKFCREIPHYDLRHSVKPGITGLSQMKGYHGSAFDPYRIYGRTKLDIFYVKNVSFSMDMMILIRTVKMIFSV